MESSSTWTESMQNKTPRQVNQDGLITFFESIGGFQKLKINLELTQFTCNLTPLDLVYVESHSALIQSTKSLILR
jgi:hypothetical protein